MKVHTLIIIIVLLLFVFDFVKSITLTNLFERHLMKGAGSPQRTNTDKKETLDNLIAKFKNKEELIKQKEGEIRAIEQLLNDNNKDKKLEEESFKKLFDIQNDIAKLQYEKQVLDIQIKFYKKKKV